MGNSPRCAGAAEAVGSLPRVPLSGQSGHMRVRFDSTRIPEEDQSGWLEDGHDYDVLEMVVTPPSGHLLETMFRIEANGIPALFAAQHFSVVDGSLPTNWAIEMGEAGGLTIGPERWQNWQGQYSFWEDFFSGVPEIERPARDAFDAEKAAPGERA